MVVCGLCGVVCWLVVGINWCLLFVCLLFVVYLSLFVLFGGFDCF